MVDPNQKKAIAKTIGALCVAFGLASMSFFIFSQDRTSPIWALICVAVGLILLTLSKRR